MIDPISIGFYIFLGFSATVMVGGFAVAAGSFAMQRYDKAKANKWNRKYSTTRHTQGEVLRFVTWFQQNTTYATHTVLGVAGIMRQPCQIPALDVPFKYNKLVMVLSHNNGTYAITVSSNSQARIAAFWNRI